MYHITIDYTPAYEQGGGIGRYVRELTSALSQIDTHNNYRLFVSGARKNDLPTPLSPNFNWSTTLVTPSWLARIWHRARLPIPIEIMTGRIDLLHATDFVLPPTLPTTKTLLTVHDLSFIRVPETASPSLKAYLDKVVPRSVKNANHILADSEATKNDLIEIYHTPADKITVLLSGVDEHFKPIKNQAHLNKVRKQHGLTELDYILSVGTVQPRKNYSRIILALKQLHNQGINIHYAIAGGKGWLEDEMYQTIKETDLEEYVHLLGFVDDEDLPALYSASSCLVITSLYEGFGLPILESMACGTPVITSNLSSLPEVAGTAGILIDPYNIDELTDNLKTILQNPAYRDQLTHVGHEQVKKFTWGKSAKHLKSIYENLLSS